MKYGSVKSPFALPILLHPCCRRPAGGAVSTINLSSGEAWRSAPSAQRCRIKRNMLNSRGIKKKKTLDQSRTWVFISLALLYFISKYVSFLFFPEQEDLHSVLQDILFLSEPNWAKSCPARRSWRGGAVAVAESCGVHCLHSLPELVTAQSYQEVN